MQRRRTKRKQKKIINKQKKIINKIKVERNKNVRRGSGCRLKGLEIKYVFIFILPASLSILGAFVLKPDWFCCFWSFRHLFFK